MSESPIFGNKFAANTLRRVANRLETVANDLGEVKTDVAVIKHRFDNVDKMEQTIKAQATRLSKLERAQSKALGYAAGALAVGAAAGGIIIKVVGL